IGCSTAELRWRPHVTCGRRGRAACGGRAANGPCGGQGQNRTADTAIFSRMLYRLSYLATMKTQRTAGAWRCVFSGFLAEPTGFEPATFCVTGRYANRYTTAPRKTLPARQAVP